MFSKPVIVGKSAMFWKQQADVSAPWRCQVIHDAALDLDLPAIRAVESRDGLEQRRFSRIGRPDDVKNSPSATSKSRPSRAFACRRTCPARGRRDRSRRRLQPMKGNHAPLTPSIRCTRSRKIAR